MAWQGMATEFLQVPAVTRTYTAACVLTTAAVVSRAGGRVGIAMVTALEVAMVTVGPPPPPPSPRRGAAPDAPWFRSSWNSSALSSSTLIRTSCSGSSR